MLDLCEGLLDRVEVGGVFGQEPQAGFDSPEHGDDGLSLVAAQVVKNDDVAGPQGRDQNLLDIGSEAFAVDRAIEDAGGGKPIEAQRTQESEGLPAPLRSKADQALAFGSPAAERCHIRPDPGLVDEDETLVVEAPLPGLPALAPLRDVGPAALKSEQSFF